MDKKQFTAVGAKSGGEARIISVESFTKAGLVYEVFLDTPRSCECKHHETTGARCRHIITALVIEKIRRSAFGTRHDEEVARRIISRVLDRRNDLGQSYDALSEVRYWMFATRELIEVAHARHRENVKRELARLEGRAA